MLSAVLFTLAAAMLAYDAGGHLCAGLAHWSARSRWRMPALLWNKYSLLIWPRIEDQERYEWRWAAWHLTTLVLFSAAFYFR